MPEKSLGGMPPKSDKRRSRRYLLIGLLLIPLIADGGLLFWERVKNYTLFPRNQAISFRTYTDQTQPQGIGCSTVDTFRVTDSLVYLSYTLRKGYDYPFAGMQGYTIQPNSSMDLSAYDLVEFVVTPLHVHSLHLILHTFEQDISNWKDCMTMRFLEKDLTLEPGTRRYRIPLNQLITPTWWLIRQGLGDTTLARPDYSRCIDICFQNTLLTPLDSMQSFTVHSIVFRKGISGLIKGTSIFTVIFYTLVAGWVFMARGIRRKRLEPRVSVIAYQPLPLEANAKDESETVINFIGKHYSDSTVTLLRMSLEIGIGQQRISNILKKRTGLSFKQYLNTVRISEAKRLLLETENQIVEIARKVGYSHATHFNRIFKEYLLMTPGDFRKNPDDDRNQ